MNVIIGDSSKIMLISIKGCFLIFCAVNKVRDDDSILFSLCSCSISSIALSKFKES